MTKILLDNDQIWYREIAPSSFMSEGNLENTIISYLGSYLTEHYVVKCKMNIKNARTGRTNQPDIAIVKKDYSEWYVVEVELSSHRINHIEEQVDTFCNCDYGDEHAEYLSKNSTTLDKGELKKMIAKYPPRVMVVVNDQNCKWTDTLKKYKCEVGIFQVYYDKHQNRLYRFHGHFPVMKHDFGTCKFLPGVPQMIELIENDFLDGLNIKSGDAIIASYKGKVARWKRRGTRKVYLECTDSEIPLDPLSSRYLIIYHEQENEFEFIKA